MQVFIPDSEKYKPTCQTTLLTLTKKASSIFKSAKSQKEQDCLTIMKLIKKYSAGLRSPSLTGISPEEQISRKTLSIMRFGTPV